MTNANDTLNVTNIPEWKYTIGKWKKTLMKH